jgi:hypothetical protein
VGCRGNDREGLVKEGGERMGHVHLPDEASQSPEYTIPRRPCSSISQPRQNAIQFVGDTVEQGARPAKMMTYLLIKTLSVHELSMSIDRRHSCNPFRAIGAERGNDAPSKSACEATWAPTVCRGHGNAVLCAVDSSQ